MQIPKPRSRISEVAKRTSLVTPRLNPPGKVPGFDSASASSTRAAIKAPGDRRPKIKCHLPRAMANEKKRPGGVTELECQLIQLQEDLKKTRYQLSLTESWKRRAQQEAEEAKRQLLATSEKLEDSQNQLVELSAAEEARLKELRKISQERDRAWQSELEAIQQQYSIDSAALASAVNEIKRLKVQLEMVLRSEAAHVKKSEMENSELQASRKDLAEALFMIENLSVQLRDSEKAESESKLALMEAKGQLERAQNTIDTLLTDGSKLMESFSIVAIELKGSRSKVDSLEQILRNLQENQSSTCSQASGGFDYPKSICCGTMDSEVELLMPALEATMIKHQKEQIESIIKLQSAYEMLDKMSNESMLRESEFELRQNDVKSEVKAHQFDKEMELTKMLDINTKLEAEREKVQTEQFESELGLKLSQSLSDVSRLKEDIMDKEITLQIILKENEQLKLELRRIETERHEACEIAIAEMKLAKDAEKKALVKLGSVTAEAEENSLRSERDAEQLDADQAIKSEMEAELKRLRVQADQWRKAAEAAAAVLTAGDTGKSADRTSSLNSRSNSVANKLMNSLLSDELDDESQRNKRNKMLRKISRMWKKDYK